MNTSSRRQFIRNASLAGIASSACSWLTPAASAAAVSLARPSSMHLGTVTYNLARDWDVDTLIKNCQATGFEGVELRTTHAHGVEVALGRDERTAIKRRFIDSGIQLHSLGSAFDYHTTDATKLRKDIEATKEYIVLAHDVGARGIKVRPNGLPEGVPVEKTLAQISRSLMELARFSEGYGIEIRVEVHGAGTALLPNMKTIMDAAGHPLVGVCWNCNPTDLEGDGFDHNFDLVKDRILLVHMRDLYLDTYPFRHLFRRLREIGYVGFCLAEIPSSADPLRVMHYYRGLWLAYQDLL